MSIHILTMDIVVDDEAQLREAAYQQALKDGCDETYAAQYKDPDVMGIDNCLIMVIDPGSVPGCSIGGTEVEVHFNGDEDDED